MLYPNTDPPPLSSPICPSFYKSVELIREEDFDLLIELLLIQPLLTELLLTELWLLRGHRDIGYQLASPLPP